MYQEQICPQDTPDLVMLQSLHNRLGLHRGFTQLTVIASTHSLVSAKYNNYHEQQKVTPCLLLLFLLHVQSQLPFSAYKLL